ncbi:MAG TPA: pyruvate kinase [Caldilineae bacterium]|nr:pyruvate kinase [Caldilineae bacterium]
MLRTKIVCTIGPASWDPEVLVQLIEAGMDVARLNFSHGDRASHEEIIRRIRAAAEKVGRPVGILVDLQGPRLRVGELPSGGIRLEPGTRIVLTTASEIGQPGRIPVQFAELPRSVHPGDRILIDDGLLELRVREVDEDEVICEVIAGGVLTSHKGMNIPNVPLDIPAITEKDKEDLRFAVAHQVDWIAMSFVRTADEVYSLRDMIIALSDLARPIPIIAKIEKPEAVRNIDAIIEASDGIMVARGDLGIETSPEAVPMIQKEIIAKCNQAGVPVITATQMLDSMIRNPRPTRAEASDVANAILDGTDAIMLSGETAIGKYPIEAVRTMSRIAEEAERALKPVDRAPRWPGVVAEAVAHASVNTAIELTAAAIIAPTSSGFTARLLSRFRPPCTIVAVTPNPIVQRQLTLYWGVRPLFSPRATDTDAMIADAVKAAREHGYVNEGDTVVITAGSAGSAPGTTDLMKVQEIARVLARGQGLGSHPVLGRIRRLEPPLPSDIRVEPNEIIATPRTDRTFIESLRRAAGLILGEGSLECHGALLATELGLPAVIGVGDALDRLKDGQMVLLDPLRGVIEERKEGPPIPYGPKQAR